MMDENEEKLKRHDMNMKLRIQYRKKFFKRLFSSDKADSFLNSPFFELSQQIVELENVLKLDTEQVAEIVHYPLSQLIDVEMGVSPDLYEYRIAIDRLKVAISEQARRIWREHMSPKFEYLDDLECYQAVIIEGQQIILHDSKLYRQRWRANKRLQHLREHDSSRWRLVRLRNAVLAE